MCSLSGQTAAVTAPQQRSQLPNVAALRSEGCVDVLQTRALSIFTVSRINGLNPLAGHSAADTKPILLADFTPQQERFEGAALKGDDVIQGGEVRPVQ